jgi:hypothetical protein
MDPNTDEARAFEVLREVYLTRLKVKGGQGSEPPPMTSAAAPALNNETVPCLHPLVVEAMRCVDER